LENQVVQLKNHIEILRMNSSFQNEEREKRADELDIANIELKYQNKEKKKRAEELILIHVKYEKEAIEICMGNSNISLILMDIKMPTMDGHEASKQIKEFRPQLPIIAQSAYSLEQYREIYGAMTFDDYISKPINEDELKRKLLRFVNTHSPN